MLEFYYQQTEPSKSFSEKENYKSLHKYWRNMLEELQKQEENTLECIVRLQEEKKGWEMNTVCYISKNNSFVKDSKYI